jgi:hypothetical protein
LPALPDARMLTRRLMLSPCPPVLAASASVYPGKIETARIIAKPRSGVNA